jgi:ribosome-associated toxin RatA of RatAB toxin-antitoxin module
MNVVAELEAPCSPATLFALVDRLDGYPSWMPLAHRVVASNDGDGDVLAWWVELRARVGPFARSKQLRMERTVHDADRCSATFERRELDGRAHAPWRLDVIVTPTSVGSRVEMRLHYGGTLWTSGVLERVLADQIESGRERLLAVVENAT